MSTTQVLRAGDQLPYLWLFEVPALIVCEVEVDGPCWIAAVNETVALAYLRDRHRAKRIAHSPRDRKIKMARMVPAVREDTHPLPLVARCT